MTLSVHHSSAKSDWQTPDEVLERVRRIDAIGLDPCAGYVADIAERVIRPPQDGLAIPWTGHGLVYVNSPYGRVIGRWMAKCATEAEDGAEIVALPPARPDTRWFHESVFEAANAVCFWRGRLTFKGAPHPAPFPTAVVYYGRRLFDFFDAFADAGRIIAL